MTIDYYWYKSIRVITQSHQVYVPCSQYCPMVTKEQGSSCLWKSLEKIKLSL